MSGFTIPCPFCEATGELWIVKESEDEVELSTITCMDCFGSGEIELRKSDWEIFMNEYVW